MVDKLCRSKSISNQIIAKGFTESMTTIFNLRTLLNITFVVMVCACSTTHTTSNKLANDTTHLWDDTLFSDNEVQLIQADDVFRLGPDLESKIRSARLRDANIQTRVNFLLELIYSNENRPFVYEGYHSTIASETWAKNRGDCLSLSILAYALGKRLELPIAIQEVPMPVQFDRHGNTEYLQAHVNSIILNPQLTLSAGTFAGDRGYMLIDFDPSQFTQRRGVPLSESEIMAHFYNNLAVEAMIKKDNRLAYAYFKAAATIMPSHATTYSNLSAFYARLGYKDKAIKVLEYAMHFADDNPIVLRGVQKLYRETNRLEAAAGLEKRLIALQDSNPYYWIGKGLSSLQSKEYGQAINYLERAQKLTSGFEEVHQALAEAYWKTGATIQAKQQIQLLASINASNPKLNYLRANFTLN